MCDGAPRDRDRHFRIPAEFGGFRRHARFLVDLGAGESAGPPDIVQPRRYRAGKAICNFVVYLNKTKIPSPYIGTKTQGFIPDIFIQDSFSKDDERLWLSLSPGRWSRTL